MEEAENKENEKKEEEEKRGMRKETHRQFYTRRRTTMSNVGALAS